MVDFLVKVEEFVYIIILFQKNLCKGAPHYTVATSFSLLMATGLIDARLRSVGF